MIEYGFFNRIQAQSGEPRLILLFLRGIVRPTQLWLHRFSLSIFEPRWRLFSGDAAFNWLETCQKKNYWNSLASSRSFFRTRLFA
jgi:hypothetical protein